MRVRVGAALLLFSLAVPVLATAADQPEPKPAPGPQAREFARVFVQWKSLLAELGTLKVRYRAAEPRQKPGMEKQWAQLMEQSKGLRDQLIQAAEKAYAEAPNADRQVTELLIGMLVEWTHLDDFEKAMPVGKLLMDGGCGDKRAAELAGLAAVAVNEFDLAKPWLAAGGKGRKPSPLAQEAFVNLAYYRAAWAKEKQLRQAEAKADDLPRVLLRTSQGDIELELFENEAPNTVANFLLLVEKKFYDGLKFHRVLPHFMAQTGSPTNDAVGGPGYRIAGEFRQPNHRQHFRGSLAMARAEDPDSAGSQFYLMFFPKGELDGRYTVFGRVVKGLDVLAKIQRVDPDKREEQPKSDKIIEAKVLRKRKHEYVVKKLEE